MNNRINFFGILKRISKIKPKKATTVLLLSNILIMPIGILISVFLTRLLGASNYGEYSYILNFANFVILLTSLGLYHSAARVITLTNSWDELRGVLGASLILGLIILILSVITIFSWAHFEFLSGKLKKFDFVIFCTLITASLLLIRYCEVLLPARGEIEKLAASKVAPKLLYLAILILMFIANSKKVDLYIFEFSIISFFISSLLVISIIIYRLKPSLRGIKRSIDLVIDKQKEFGFNVYLGSIISVGFSYFIPIAIGLVEGDYVLVGHFTLALTLATPLAIIPTTIATVNFRSFAQKRHVSQKTIVGTLVTSLIIYLLMLIFIGPVVDLLYGEKFENVKSIFMIVITGFLFHGWGDFFNKYLIANGAAKVVRNISLFLGLTMSFIGMGLIIFFGVTGAAITKSLTGFTYLLLCYSAFKKVNQSQSERNAV